MYFAIVDEQASSLAGFSQILRRLPHHERIEFHDRLEEADVGSDRVTVELHAEAGQSSLRCDPALQKFHASFTKHMR